MKLLVMTEEQWESQFANYLNEVALQIDNDKWDGVNNYRRLLVGVLSIFRAAMTEVDDVELDTLVWDWLDSMNATLTDGPSYRGPYFDVGPDSFFSRYLLAHIKSEGHSEG